MSKSAFYLRLKYGRVCHLFDREIVEKKKDKENHFSL